MSSPASSKAPQPPGLRRAGLGDLLPRHQQDPQRLPVAVGPRHRQLARVQAQRGQHRQVRVDRVGLAFAAALLTAGLLTLEHQQPGTASARASPIPYPRVPSMHTATRGPGAISAIAASSRANPALSLPIRSTAIGLPAGSAISTS